MSCLAEVLLLGMLPALKMYPACARNDRDSAQAMALAGVIVEMPP